MSAANRIVIPYRIPSQNVTNKRHYMVNHRDGKRVEDMVIYTCLANNITKATGKRTITITSVRKRIVTDDANIRGGAKQLVDAIKRAGYLIDDCDKMADIRYEQKTTKQWGGPECTCIEFGECEP
jgi:hypothetical protein